MTTPLKATVKQITGNQATLILETNQEIFWPLDKLPSSAGTGAAVFLSLSLTPVGDDNAKNILNEILKPENKLQ